VNATQLVICEDSDALAAEAAEFICHCARVAIAERGRFSLVLSGGSTPERAYTLLAQPAGKRSLDWSKTYIFFGDERFVPPDDPRSNFRMARRTLLNRVPTPPSQMFPIRTDEPTAAAAALRYAAELAFLCRCGILPRWPAEPTLESAAGKRQDAASTILPRFDLILLGLGEDGHTASLFPGAAALGVEDAWVTWSRPGRLPPPVDRITMTYPVLNAARQVAFLVAGESKAAVLRDVLEGTADRRSLPAAGVQPRDGQLTWFVDQDAARLLSREA
jgi:6-phosphogluconolactonase